MDLSPLKKKPVLVTGVAGFIGYSVAKVLLEHGVAVVGVDNLNDYYDVNLKLNRLAQLKKFSDFQFSKFDVADREAVESIFLENKFAHVIHLAAQAGVRYSLNNPHQYINSNITGFLNILEGCRHNSTDHLVFASSSSVYGANTKLPFSPHDPVDHPVSLYAASKKANELMAHSYAHLYGLPATGLRFFTVYGPWGRPDMALFKFTKAILADEPIDVYNNGNMLRDFTYVSDIVEGILRVACKTPKSDPQWNAYSPDPATSKAPYKIYNIGNNQPINLLDCITLLEKSLGRCSRKNMMPLQPGDVPGTHADVSDLAADFDYYPKTSLAEGIDKFVQWYCDYYDHAIPKAVAS